MKVVDSARMAKIDLGAQERFSIPQSVLMEDAGLGLYSCLRQRIWKGRLPDGLVVFLVGKGNNGGDALVAARHCRYAGLSRLALVLAAGPPEAGSLPAAQLEICRRMSLEVVDYRSSRKRVHALLDQAEWLIDGLLGTGLSGAARPPLAQLIERSNRCAARRVAFDIPSGVGDAYRRGYPAFQADYTLTVELPKQCLYLPHARRFCGEIVVVSGVFPRELSQDEAIPGDLIGSEPQEQLPARLPADVHKGGRGHLAVFAGSEGTTGAAWLCSTAAARSRAGLVTLFVDPELYGHSIAKFSSVMVRPRPEQVPDLGRFDALLVGPGWGLSGQRRGWLEVLLRCGLPGVLDADGLTLLAGLRQERKLTLGNRWVLTPHPGEFARLAGQEIEAVLDDPLASALRLSAELQAVLVLKGHCTLVVSPDGRYGILDGMNPALATGGSGDVLAGMIGGLMVSGLAARDAARLAVALHSRIGRRLHQEQGYFLAEDMIPAISALYAEG